MKKAVNLKHETITPVLVHGITHVYFVYEVLDPLTGLVDTFSVHKQLPDASSLNLQETIDAAKLFCVDYCHQLQQRLIQEEV